MKMAMRRFFYRLRYRPCFAALVTVLFGLGKTIQRTPRELSDYRIYQYQSETMTYNPEILPFLKVNQVVYVGVLCDLVAPDEASHNTHAKGIAPGHDLRILRQSDLMSLLGRKVGE